MLVFLLQVAGPVALLVYSVRMVRTGAERAFSSQLRWCLRVSSGNRLVAASSGAVVAMLLQSATALGLMAAGFISSGTISTGVGFAMLLGADVGSAFVLQLVVIRPAWIASLLLIVGVAVFSRAQLRSARQTGRILIGLALVFVALDLLATATGPLSEFSGLQSVANYLSHDLVSAFFLGALLSWGIHSSVAAVLLIMTAAATGVLPIEVGTAIVLGANLGGSLIVVSLTLGANTGARQMVWANVLVRGGGALACLAALPVAIENLSWLGSLPAQQIINLHLAFNVLVVTFALPFQSVLLWAICFLVKESKTDGQYVRTTSLDPRVLTKPEAALALAAREVLHMGEVAGAMLAPLMPLFSKWDSAAAERIREDKARLDYMYTETKKYLAQMKLHPSEPDLAQKVANLVDQAGQYSAAGDAIARLAFGLARKLHSEGMKFPDEEYRDLSDFYEFVLSNAQATLHVQMTRDPTAARELVQEKERARSFEKLIQNAHLVRLRMGDAVTVATSNIHQATLQELKQVNTCFIKTAYPILAESGDLLDTRLKRWEPQ